MAFSLPGYLSLSTGKWLPRRAGLVWALQPSFLGARPLDVLWGASWRTVLPEVGSHKRVPGAARAWLGQGLSCNRIEKIKCQ